MMFITNTNSTKTKAAAQAISIWFSNGMPAKLYDFWLSFVHRFVLLDGRADGPP
jgi:hypothetical protein